MTEQTQFYYAFCEGCGRVDRFLDYQKRSTWVGEHRVKTGHTVRMETRDA